MAGKRKRVIKKEPPVEHESFISSQKIRFSKMKLKVVGRNLVLFVLLFLISYVLYIVSVKDVFINIFYFLWIIFGFISLAFFIALLVLLFLKLIRR